MRGKDQVDRQLAVERFGPMVDLATLWRGPVIAWAQAEVFPDDAGQVPDSAPQTQGLAFKFPQRNRLHHAGSCFRAERIPRKKAACFARLRAERSVSGERSCNSAEVSALRPAPGSPCLRVA